MEKLLDRQVSLTESEEKTSYLTSRINLSSRIRGGELSGFYIKRMFMLIVRSSLEAWERFEPSLKSQLKWEAEREGRGEPGRG